MKKTIDINCDLGESYGNYKVGNDDEIFPFLSSCNIACGFHGGDPLCMKKTIAKAIAHNVQIGAHPSYPDRLGFGRNKMNIKGLELQAIIEYQIAALKSMTESQNAKLKYVKPHGALYNSISQDLEEAKYVLDAIYTIDDSLKVMVLAGSPLQKYMKEQNYDYISEAFADRRYEPDGTLASRSKLGSEIVNPDAAVAQVLSIISSQQVETLAGGSVKVDADSICIHGDNNAAVAIASAIQQKLSESGVEIKAFN